MTEAERANKVLRLNQLARRIDSLADRLRYQATDPLVSDTMWSLCAVHEELVKDLREEFGVIQARGTIERKPLPKKDDPIWKKGIGVVQAVLQYLDEVK